MAPSPVPPANSPVLPRDVVRPALPAARCAPRPRADSDNGDLGNERVLQAVLEELLTGSPIAVSVLDPDFRYLWVNAGAAAINGLAADQHVGRRFRDVVPDIAEACEPRLRAALAERRPVLGDEVSGSTPADPGRARWWRVDWLPVWLDDRPAALAAMFTDVTVQKAHEAAAREDSERARAAADVARAAEEVAQRAAERARGRLSALHAVTDAALLSLDVDDLLAEILPRIRDALAADSAGVCLLDAEGRRLRARRPGQPCGAGIPVGDGVIGRVVRTRIPVVVEDLSGVPTADEPALSGMGSIAAVPLLARSTLIGVLHVGHSEPRHYDEGEVRLLVAAAERVALALDRSASFERQRDIAETLQRSLLPERLPDLPGLRLAARYEAGELGLTVGGDWYDAVPLRRGRVALVIGDVMGHGLEAAATMGRLRTELHAHLHRGDSPAQALGELNRSLAELRSDEIATAYVAVLDLRSRTLRAANAGHPPPVLVRAGGRGRTVSTLARAPGPPLGVLDRPGYVTSATALQPGDTLLLYTDGLVERRDRPLDSGIDELCDLMKAESARDGGPGTGTLEALFARRLRVDDGAALLATLV